MNTTIDSIESKRSPIFIRPRWGGEEGIRNLMAVALPLIASNAIHAVNMFVDRTLLAQYSDQAFAAALQGGFICWGVMTLFFQTVMFSSTFIAQYTGAKADHKVGKAFWHGIYMALVGGVILAAIAPLGFPFFRWVGHEGVLPELEARYFFILTVCAIAPLLNVAFSGFYTGRGKTGFVMLVNLVTVLYNIVLDVWFIFAPPAPFPGGIEGAAWATVIATMTGNLIFAIAIFKDRLYEDIFRVRSAWRPSWTMFARLLRFGLPAGIHHTTDMVAFGTFFLIVGLFGFEAQHASNMAMNLNFLFFIPAVGMSIGVTILAGQFVGAKQYRKAEVMTAGASLIMMAYMVVVCFLYIGIPDYILVWFRGGIEDAQWTELVRVAHILLIFVAIYSTFDALLLTYSGTLKGAGDTRFVMWVAIIFSQLLLTLPSLLLASQRHRFEDPTTGLYVAWGLCSGYIIFLGLMYIMRYVNGAWKSISMIDEPADKLPPAPKGELPATAAA